jgi:hypothetical protein
MVFGVDRQTWQEYPPGFGVAYYQWWVKHKDQLKRDGFIWHGLFHCWRRFVALFTCCQVEAETAVVASQCQLSPGCCALPYH